jgi:hypothetical protein
MTAWSLAASDDTGRATDLAPHVHSPRVHNLSTTCPLGVHTRFVHNLSTRPLKNKGFLGRFVHSVHYLSTRRHRWGGLATLLGGGQPCRDQPENRVHSASRRFKRCRSKSLIASTAASPTGEPVIATTRPATVVKRSSTCGARFAPSAASPSTPHNRQARNASSLRVDARPTGSQEAG